MRTLIGRVLGDFIVGDKNTVHVATTSRKPYIFVSDEAAASLRAGDCGPLAACLMPQDDAYFLKETSRVPSYAQGAIVFYQAQHPRQRIMRAQCRGATILEEGDYGSSVIAHVRKDGCLVFRHRRWVERIYIDKGSLVVRTYED